MAKHLLLVSGTTPPFILSSHQPVSLQTRFRMKINVLSTLLVALIGVQAISPLRLRPKWRELLEEVLQESDRSELNLFGRPVDGDKLDKKMIT